MWKYSVLTVSSNPRKLVPVIAISFFRLRNEDLNRFVETLATNVADVARAAYGQSELLLWRPNGSKRRSGSEDGMNLAKRFIREEEGQDLVEYALLLALVVLAAASGTSIFGVNLGAVWSGLVGNVSGFLGS
jgi:Flp pilus assembly pilin Flp